jgi:hypothetical protein
MPALTKIERDPMISSLLRKDRTDPVIISKQKLVNLEQDEGTRRRDNQVLPGNRWTMSVALSAVQEGEDVMGLSFVSPGFVPTS